MSAQKFKNSKLKHLFCFLINILIFIVLQEIKPINCLYSATTTLISTKSDNQDSTQHSIKTTVSAELKQLDFSPKPFIPITPQIYNAPTEKLMMLPLNRSDLQITRSNDVSWKDVWNGLKASFHIPWKELFTQKGDSELENFLQEFGCGASVAFALKKSEPKVTTGVTTKGPLPLNKSTLGMGFRYVPLTNWYVSIAFSYLLQPELKAPWDPDFTYAFGYNDWHPFTLSLEYSNYGGNRLLPNRAKGEQRTHFMQGSFTLGWKFLLPKKIERHFKIFKSSELGGGLAWQYSPEFGMDEKNKHTLSLGLKYGIYKYLFFSITLNYYPKPEQQMDWDPDFTYSFGWSDWHAGKIAITYSNYAPNSYFWKKNRGGTFWDGGIGIGYSCDFSFLFD